MPFAGDTTVATLMARVGAVLPAARELGPLAPVLAQAAISEPLARLDAAALAFELETLLLELDTPEPLPLNRTDLALPSLPLGLDRDPTERFGLAGSSPAPAAPQALPPQALAPQAPPSQASPPAPVQASRLAPPPPLPETAEPQVAVQPPDRPQRRCRRPCPVFAGSCPRPTRSWLNPRETGAGTDGCLGFWPCCCWSSSRAQELSSRPASCGITPPFRESSGCRSLPRTRFSGGRD